MTVFEVLDHHIPSLSEANDAEIDDLLAGEEVDNADLAVRTCHCGLRIDGFYEYVDHLRNVLQKEVR